MVLTFSDKNLADARNRLLGLISVDQATDDCIYYLGKALENNVISIDDWLKVIVLIHHHTPLSMQS